MKSKTPDISTSLVNVLFDADPTWTYGNNKYQQTNLQLVVNLMRSNSIPCSKPQEDNSNYSNPSSSHTRTVQDTIPFSRLATYGSYEYDEVLERTHDKDDAPVQYETNFPCSEATESWMLEEVEEQFQRYMTGNALKVETWEQSFPTENPETPLKFESGRPRSTHDSRRNTPPFDYSDIPPDKQQFKAAALNCFKYTLDSEEERQLEEKLCSEEVKDLWNNETSQRQFWNPEQRFESPYDAQCSYSSNYRQYPVYDQAFDYEPLPLPKQHNTTHSSHRKSLWTSNYDLLTSLRTGSSESQDIKGANFYRGYTNNTPNQSLKQNFFPSSFSSHYQDDLFPYKQNTSTPLSSINLDDRPEKCESPTYSIPIIYSVPSPSLATRPPPGFSINSNKRIPVYQRPPEFYANAAERKRLGHGADFKNLICLSKHTDSRKQYPALETGLQSPEERNQSYLWDYPRLPGSCCSDHEEEPKPPGVDDDDSMFDSPVVKPININKEIDWLMLNYKRRISSFRHALRLVEELKLVEQQVDEASEHLNVFHEEDLPKKQLELEKDFPPINNTQKRVHKKKKKSADGTGARLVHSNNSSESLSTNVRSTVRSYKDVCANNDQEIAQNLSDYELDEDEDCPEEADLVTAEEPAEPMCTVEELELVAMKPSDDNIARKYQNLLEEHAVKNNQRTRIITVENKIVPKRNKIPVLIISDPVPIDQKSDYTTDSNSEPGSSSKPCYASFSRSINQSKDLLDPITSTKQLEQDVPANSLSREDVRKTTRKASTTSTPTKGKSNQSLGKKGKKNDLNHLSPILKTGLAREDKTATTPPAKQPESKHTPDGPKTSTPRGRRKMVLVIPPKVTVCLTSSESGSDREGPRIRVVDTKNRGHLVEEVSYEKKPKTGESTNPNAAEQRVQTSPASVSQPLFPLPLSLPPEPPSHPPSPTTVNPCPVVDACSTSPLDTPPVPVTNKPAWLRPKKKLNNNKKKPSRNKPTKTPAGGEHRCEAWCCGVPVESFDVRKKTSKWHTCIQQLDVRLEQVRRVIGENRHVFRRWGSVYVDTSTQTKANDVKMNKIKTKSTNRKSKIAHDVEVKGLYRNVLTEIEMLSAECCSVISQFDMNPCSGDCMNKTYVDQLSMLNEVLDMFKQGLFEQDLVHFNYLLQRVIAMAPPKARRRSIHRDLSDEFARSIVQNCAYPHAEFAQTYYDMLVYGYRKAREREKMSVYGATVGVTLTGMNCVLKSFLKTVKLLSGGGEENEMISKETQCFVKGHRVNQIKEVSRELFKSVPMFVAQPGPNGETRYSMHPDYVPPAGQSKENEELVNKEQPVPNSQMVPCAQSGPKEQPISNVKSLPKPHPTQPDPSPEPAPMTKICKSIVASRFVRVPRRKVVQTSSSVPTTAVNSMLSNIQATPAAKNLKDAQTTIVAEKLPGSTTTPCIQKTSIEQAKTVPTQKSTIVEKKLMVQSAGVFHKAQGNETALSISTTAVNLKLSNTQSTLVKKNSAGAQSTVYVAEKLPASTTALPIQKVSSEHAKTVPTQKSTIVEKRLMAQSAGVLQKTQGTEKLPTVKTSPIIQTLSADQKGAVSHTLAPIHKTDVEEKTALEVEKSAAMQVAPGTQKLEIAPGTQYLETTTQTKAAIKKTATVAERMAHAAKRAYSKRKLRKQTEPVGQTEPSTQMETVSQTEPFSQTEPVAQTEPVSQTEPVVQTEPVAKTEPVVQREPVAHTVPATQLAPVVLQTAQRESIISKKLLKNPFASSNTTFAPQATSSMKKVYLTQTRQAPFSTSDSSEISNRSANIVELNKTCSFDVPMKGMCSSVCPVSRPNEMKTVLNPTDSLKYDHFNVNAAQSIDPRFVASKPVQLKTVQRPTATQRNTELPIEASILKTSTCDNAILSRPVSSRTKPVITDFSAPSLLPMTREAHKLIVQPVQMRNVSSFEASKKDEASSENSARETRNGKLAKTCITSSLTIDEQREETNQRVLRATAKSGMQSQHENNKRPTLAKTCANSVESVRSQQKCGMNTTLHDIPQCKHRMWGIVMNMNVSDEMEHNFLASLLEDQDPVDVYDSDSSFTELVKELWDDENEIPSGARSFGKGKCVKALTSLAKGVIETGVKADSLDIIERIQESSGLEINSFGISGKDPQWLNSLNEDNRLPIITLAENIQEKCITELKSKGNVLNDLQNNFNEKEQVKENNNNIELLEEIMCNPEYSCLLTELSQLLSIRTHSSSSFPEDVENIFPSLITCKNVEETIRNVLTIADSCRFQGDTETMHQFLNSLVTVYVANGAGETTNIAKKTSPTSKIEEEGNDALSDTDSCFNLVSDYAQANTSRFPYGQGHNSLRTEIDRKSSNANVNFQSEDKTQTNLKTSNERVDNLQTSMDAINQSGTEIGSEIKYVKKARKNSLDDVDGKTEWSSRLEPESSHCQVDRCETSLETSLEFSKSALKTVNHLPITNIESSLPSMLPFQFTAETTKQSNSAVRSELPYRNSKRDSCTNLSALKLANFVEPPSRSSSRADSAKILQNLSETTQISSVVTNRLNKSALVLEGSSRQSLDTSHNFGPPVHDSRQLDSKSERVGHVDIVTVDNEMNARATSLVGETNGNDRHVKKCSSKKSRLGIGLEHLFFENQKPKTKVEDSSCIIA